MAEDQRRHPRLQLNLPIQAQVDRADYHQMEVVDISPTGMQVRSQDFDAFKGGFDTQQNRTEYEIRIVAHLAWVQNVADSEVLSGWEFEVGGGAQVGDPASGTRSSPDDERRRYLRLQLNLPVQAQVDSSDYHDMEVVDISPTGIQFRSSDLTVFERGKDVGRIRVQFEIRIDARLAWVQTDPNGEFLTGWEFDVENEEERIG